MDFLRTLGLSALPLHERPIHIGSDAQAKGPERPGTGPDPKFAALKRLTEAPSSRDFAAVMAQTSERQRIWYFSTYSIK
jgi:hypothetical protein